MDKYDRIPLINDLRFILANENLPLRYNTWPFDRGFFQEQLQQHQHKTSYEQKRDYGDWITMYIDTLAPNIILHMLDEEGKALIEPIDYEGFYNAYEPGNTAPNEDPYYTFIARWQPSALREMPVGVEQEIYYMVVECVYPGEGESVYYVSEPLYVRKSIQVVTPTGLKTRSGWEGTMLVESRNTENNFDILYEQIPNLIFRQRVESYIEIADIIMNDTSFTDQQFKQRTLQSIPDRLYRFTAEDVPDYILDKVNRLMSCELIRIDGTRYTKNDGAKWRTDKEKGYPMGSGSIELKEYEPGGGATFAGLSASILLPLPVDEEEAVIYPFVITSLIMTDGFGLVEISSYRVFEDETELLAFIDECNDTILPAEGIAGTVAIAGNNIVYNNATDEAYVAVPGMYTCHKYIGLTLRLFASGSGAWAFLMNSTTPGTQASAIVDWGDGVVQGVGAGTTPLLITHGYPVPEVDDDRLFRLFHRGNEADAFSRITELRFPGLPTNGYFSQIAGGTHIEAPNRLTRFELRGHNLDATGSVDTSFLANVADYLKVLILKNNNIGNGTTFVPELLDYDGDPMFTALETVDISQNVFSTPGINAIISSINDHTTSTPVKFISLNAQTPAAPPSGGAATIVTTWVSSYSWTVNTD